MWSTCGAIPSTPFESSASPLLDPEAVLLVDHADARAGRTRPPARSAHGCRRSSPARPWQAAPAPPCAGPPASPRSAARTASRSSASSFPSVAACCSARVSVGAISTAWNPASSARSIEYSATTVFPDPTSPISSRCIGSPESRSRIDLVERLQLVPGRLERQRLDPPAPPAPPACPAAAPAAQPGAPACASPAPPGTGTALRTPAAPGPRRHPPRSPGKCTAGIASATAASPLRARSSAGSGSIAFAGPRASPVPSTAGSAAPSAARSPGARAPAPSARGSTSASTAKARGDLACAFRGTGCGQLYRPALGERDPRREVDPHPSLLADRGTNLSSYSRHRNPRLSREPVSSSDVPGVSFCATQGWLNQVALIGARFVADFDRDDREAAAAEGARLGAQHLDQHRRLAARLELGHRNRPCGRGGCAGRAAAGRRPSRCPPRRRLRASFGPDASRASSESVEDARAAASGRGRRAAAPASARSRRRRTTAATGRRAATTSSADRPRGSRPRPRRGRGCRSPRAGSGRPRRPAR